MGGVPSIRFPYELALKTYAFAGKDLDYALEQLSYLDIEVPDSSNPNHGTIFAAAEAKYLQYERQARRLRSDLKFTKAQADAAGIQPFYSWVMEEGNEITSQPAVFMDFIMQNIRDIRLRQIVCIGLFLQAEPREINRHIKNHANCAIWPSDVITTFQKFFWDITIMSYEDWLSYLHVTRPVLRSAAGGYRPNPHFKYLNDMTLMTNRSELVLAYRMPTTFTTVTSDEERFNKLCMRYEEALNSGDVKAIKSLGGMIAKFKEVEKEAGSEMDQQLAEDMSRLRVIATPTQAREQGVKMEDLGYIAPLPPGGVKGEISDPRMKRRPTTTQ